MRGRGDVHLVVVLGPLLRTWLCGEGKSCVRGCRSPMGW